MIKTWQQRCEEHPDHDGIVSEAMIQARMQEEIDELRAALEQAQPEMAPAFRSSHAYNVGFKDGLAAQQIQTVPAKGGLAEKVPAKGTLLEQTLKKAWDEMPHTALMDALVGGTGVMLGDKRIDPASIYKQPEQEPVAWRDHVEQRMLTWRQRFVNKSGDQLALDDFMDKRSLDDLIDFVCDDYIAPRQWQGLTEKEAMEAVRVFRQENEGGFLVDFARAIEGKLREKNHG